MGAYQGNSPFWRWLEGERGTAFPKCCGDHWIGSVWELEPADLHWLPRADCDIFRNFASHCLKTILYLTKEIIPSQLNDGWGRAAGLSTSLSGSGVEVSKAPAPDGTGLGSTPHSTYFRWFGITFKIDPRAPGGNACSETVPRSGGRWCPRWVEGGDGRGQAGLPSRIHCECLSLSSAGVALTMVRVFTRRKSALLQVGSPFPCLSSAPF